MPRVTISINANKDPKDQELLSLELPPGLTVGNLKGFVEADTQFPASSQTFYLNGRALRHDDKTLEEVGVKDGEFMAVHIRRRENQVQGSRPDRAQAGHSDARRRGTPPDPEAVRQRVLNDAYSQTEIRERRPQLFAALNDPARWREEYMVMSREEEETRRERQRQIDLLNEDPFNADAQKKIEDIIRQERVIENLQHAIEHNPEVFARVHMLYIDAEVNNHPVKAFVDSGAQATIMSPECAEKCGIMRLIDTRFNGIARGVGTAVILGRVHHAEIKIGGVIMPCAFTVMEGKDVDLLFGLDMLRRYKANINLEKNALCFEGIEVPFLPEHEIPKSFMEAQMNEPKLPGPHGTLIGTESGAITQGDQTSSDFPSDSASPAAPQVPQTAPFAPQPGPSASFPDEDIEQLMSATGVPRSQAIQALQITNGNVEHAAALLLGV